MFKKTFLATILIGASSIAMGGQALAPTQEGGCGAACAAFISTLPVTATTGGSPMAISMGGGGTTIILSGPATALPKVSALNGKSFSRKGKTYTIVIE